LAEFYSHRLPGIYDERSLRKYIKDRGKDFLKMNEKDLLQIFPDEKELSDYPGHLEVGELRLPLVYHFAPGETDDGVTLEVPVTIIGDISEKALEWGIPGQFGEKIAALVKGLPKRYRKLLVPIAEKVAIICEELELQERSLFEALADFVRRRFQVDIPASAWATADIPPHLRIRVAVIGPDGKELAASRDLVSIKKKKWPMGMTPSSDGWVRARDQWEREGLVEWNFGILPKKISVGPFVSAYPALEAGERGVNIRLFPSVEQAHASHQTGVRALFAIHFEKDLDYVKRYIVLPDEMQTQALYFGGKGALEKAIMEALQKEALEKDVRSEEEFRSFKETLTRGLFDIGHSLGEAVQEILSTYHNVRLTMSNIEKRVGNNQAIKSLIEETKKDLENLVPKDFLTQYSLERLKHIPRYLEALRLRVERARHDPAKDRAKAGQISRFIQALENLDKEVHANTSLEKRAEIEEYRWMVEEFKVSLYAPELKTAHPISAKRLLIKLKAIQSKS
jgi:ATP-dependent helicase HrpA